jgi:hypothetical protein
MTAELQAQLSLRDAAAAAAPDLQLQLSAAASADRASLEARLSQQQSQIDSLARNLAEERQLREQVRASYEEMQQRTAALAAQLAASQQSVQQLEQREAQRQAATVDDVVGGAPEKMGQGEYNGLVRKIEEADAGMRKAEAESAALKLAAANASAALHAEKANAAAAQKRLRAQLATAQQERDAALARSDPGASSGDKRRLVAAASAGSPPAGFAFSRHLRGRLISTSVPIRAVEGALFSHGAVHTRVTKALEGRQELKALLSGSGRSSPMRKSTLINGVATSLMQLFESELDGLLLDDGSFLAASLKHLAAQSSPPAPAAKPAAAAAALGLRGTAKAPPRSSRLPHPGFPQMSDGDSSDGSHDAEAAAAGDHPLAFPAAAGEAGGSQ